MCPEGTVARMIQVLKLPNGLMKILVDGVIQGRVEKFLETPVPQGRGQRPLPTVIPVDPRTEPLAPPYGEPVHGICAPRPERAE